MYHKITILGNIGSIEMRYTPSGTAVTNISVATNESWKDREGAKQKRTTWFKVSVWGAMAESANQYLSKGSQVYIEGTMQPDENGAPRTFMRNNGEPGASYEVRATLVKFVGARGQQEYSQDAPQEPTEPVISENDIPF